MINELSWAMSCTLGPRRTIDCVSDYSSSCSDEVVSLVQCFDQYPPRNAIAQIVQRLLFNRAIQYTEFTLSSSTVIHRSK